jgi:large subunit ribosomal protein L28
MVSHSNVRTRTRWLPNLVRKRYKIPELGLILSLRLSTSAIRTIDKKGGISNAIRKAKEFQLSDRLRQVRGRLLGNRASV